MTRRFITIFAALAFALMGAAVARAAYFSDIGDNQGGTQSMAYAINASGEVVGYANTTAGSLGNGEGDCDYLYGCWRHDAVVARGRPEHL